VAEAARYVDVPASTLTSRAKDALALFRAGEPLDVVADEYGVPRSAAEARRRGVAVLA
jgi:hypothetical protein